MNKKRTVADSSNSELQNGDISTRPSKSISVKAKSKIQIRNIHDAGDLLEKMSNLADSPLERKLQTLVYVAVKESLKRWEKQGTIKLPTWTGKTRVFANMLFAFQKNGLTLVPRTDLYESTARDFRTAWFQDHEIKFLHDEWGWNSEERMLSLLSDPKNDWLSGRVQCIMTYQALTSLVRRNSEMGEFIRSHFGMIIEDEAHRGLWDKTKQATSALTNEEVDAAELDAEIEAESILWINLGGEIGGGRYNYKFTATPDLLEKSVTENGEYIFYATIEDAVRTGAIILPQHVKMGAAYSKTADLDTWNPAEIDSLAEGDNFVDEDGNSIRVKIINAYLEMKAKHERLPAVAFASTIEHARQIVELMQSRWINAARVTSSTGDMRSSEAIKLMDAGELDVMVTVTKVSEGFDYPPLSCAMWFAPSLSPAKILQGNGRIMRETHIKKPAQTTDEKGKLVPSPNSYIIAPSEWHGGPSPNYLNDNSEVLRDGNQKDDEKTARKRKLPRIGNFYELLIAQWEISAGSISEGMQDVINWDEIRVCDIWEEIEIGGIIYVGVTNRSMVADIQWKRILRNARSSSIETLSARQRSGYYVELVPKSFIESMKIDYYCQSGEEVSIEGVPHIGIICQASFSTHGLTWLTIVRKARAAWVECLAANQGNGYSLVLVPKAFVESIQIGHVCEVGAEKEIEWVCHVWITQKSCILGIEWYRILKQAKAKGIAVIKAKQANNHPVQLIPKSFIEKLLNTCEHSEEKEINGTVYIGVTVTAKEVLGISGQTIVYNARNAKINLLDGIQKNGLGIQLVPKSFIESLLQEVKPGDEEIIDEIVHIRVSNNSEIMWMAWVNILSRARKAGVQLHRWENNQKIQLVPKAFIEGLLDTCESCEEKTIDGIVYIAIKNWSNVLFKGETGRNILRKAKTAGIHLPSTRQKSGKPIQLVPKSFIEWLGLKK